MKRVLIGFLSVTFLFCGLNLQGEEDLPLYRETKHIALYCLEGEQHVSDAILERVEDEYHRIADDLDFIIEDKIPIVVYPSLQALGAGIEWKEAPPWVVGGLTPEGVIRMVSPVCPRLHFDYGRMMQVPLHNLALSMIRHRFPEAPAWLAGGISHLEAGISLEKMIGYMCSRVNSKGFPTLEEFENNQLFNREGLHPFAYSAVNYIIETKGREALLDLLEDYTAFDAIIGMSRDDFWPHWKAYFYVKYMD